MYPTKVDSNNQILFDTRGGSNSNNHRCYLAVSGSGCKILHYNGSNTEISYDDIVIPLHAWSHIALASDGTNMRCYVNGKYNGVGTKPYWDNGNGADIRIGDLQSGAGGSTYAFKGYIDQFRIRSGAISTSTNTTNWSNGYSEPTRAFGAYGPETPDVGTITLTATGDGDFTWSEVAAGTALPGSLAVGSTTHSGSGNSRTHTATITGTLPVNASTTYTNGVKGDTATNNILLIVQHETDATKAVTLNGTTGLGITQKSTGRPLVFNARRYIGNQLAREHTGYGFQPDLIWVKNRNTTISHMVVDSVRGLSGTGGGALLSDSNAAADGTERITEITSDGYQHYKSGDYTYTNTTDKKYITWAWRAGGAPSSSALSLSGGFGAGTMSGGVTNATSVTQSVNQNGGFSITKFTGHASGGAFPHNLGGTPDWIIIKNLSDTQHWTVWHSGVSSKYGFLSLNNPFSNNISAAHFDTGPTSSSILFGTDTNNGGSASHSFVCYAWKAVAGVSAFGTYTGNSGGARSVTGLGFSPSFLIVKRTDGAGNWYTYDKFRGVCATGTSTHTDSHSIALDSDEVERQYDGWHVAFDSNGFTFPDWNRTGVNNSGESYIYMAFA